LQRLYEQERPPGIDAFYLPVGRVFPNAGTTVPAVVKQVVLLEWGIGGHWIRGVSAEEAATTIADGAYHMPDDQDVRAWQVEFWRRELQAVRCHAVDVRSQAVTRPKLYEDLVELFRGGL
jgi:hypothetical protein